MNTRTIICLAAAVTSAAASAAAFSGDAVKSLAPGEQIELVRTVNAAMPSFGVKDETRTLTTYRINRDILRAASPVDRKRVLAEVFATAPEYSLPALADGLAAEVFNRKAAGFAKKDDSFQNFALSAMLTIYRRCRADNSLELSNQRRLVFAVVMFLKASEGDPEDLLDQLIVFVPDSVREAARNLWIPAAMGQDGKKGTYRPLVEAQTNDVKVAESELPNDNARIMLSYPASEQASETLRQKSLSENSASQVEPGFRNDFDATVNQKPWMGTGDDINRKSDPIVYGSQGY